MIISGLVLQGTAADNDLPLSLCRELGFSLLVLLSGLRVVEMVVEMVV